MFRLQYLKYPPGDTMNFGC